MHPISGIVHLATTTSTAAASGSAVTLNELVTLLTIFALAVFVGFEIITKVPPTLHTPLMSGSNAISGITIIGALIVSLPRASWINDVLALLAVALATINVVGGYLVTDRMLAMFRRRKS
jgi:NAD(P) transhydrogenase subunit alpha